MKWHPASLLLAWACFAVILQGIDWPWILFPALLCLVWAQLRAPLRNRRMLLRTRWLLLSLLILFSFFTPGEFLPGLAGEFGLTIEGVRSAVEHGGRLIALLSSLALLHELIGTLGMLSGLYFLLGPGRWREKTIVRLMLILEWIEAKQYPDWRVWLQRDVQSPVDSLSCKLAMPPMRGQDWWLIGVALMSLLTGLLVR